MEYDPDQNSIIIFGGQTHEGQYCKPVIQVFDLPRWLVAQEPADYEIVNDAFACSGDLRLLKCSGDCGCLPTEEPEDCKALLAELAAKREAELRRSNVHSQQQRLHSLLALI